MQFTVELRITALNKSRLLRSNRQVLKKNNVSRTWTINHRLPFSPSLERLKIFLFPKILEKINYILKTKPLCLIVSLVLNGSKGL